MENNQEGGYKDHQRENYSGHRRDNLLKTAQQKQKNRLKVGMKTIRLSVWEKSIVQRSKQLEKKSVIGKPPYRKGVARPAEAWPGHSPFRQPRESSRPKMPIQPPRNRKPTVRSKRGSPTMVEQIVPIWSKALVATVPRSVSRLAIAEGELDSGKTTFLK